MSILISLGFQINSPTINMWSNRLMAQWDLYLDNHSLALTSLTSDPSLIKFKLPNPEVIIPLFSHTIILDG